MQSKNLVFLKILLDVHQPKGGGLKGMPGTFVGNVTTGCRVQLLVNQRHQLRQGLFVASAPSKKQTGHLLR